MSEKQGELSHIVNMVIPECISATRWVETITAIMRARNEKGIRGIIY